MASLSFSYNTLPKIDFQHVIFIASDISTFTTSLMTIDTISSWNPENIHFIQKTAQEKLSVSSETCSTIDLMIQQDAKLIKITLAVTPNGSSRHNTPSRSHAIAAMIKASKGTDNLLVVLLTQKEYFYAQALAVARQFPLYSMKSSASKDFHVHVTLNDETKDEKVLQDIIEVSESIRLAQKLGDMPPNFLHTDSYVAIVNTIAKDLGCGIEVIQGQELEARGFGGLWNVGKASEHLPALVVLSHVPSQCKDEKSICLVGKGIVYDTGGLSIKTPTNVMAGMKTDMLGSAAVLGAFVTCVKRNIHKCVHAFLCISENSVGPLSFRPDDIITFLSGKTCEVNNTDAEGRLVLSDGCFYATSEKFNAGYIIDIATLTGAQLIATGKNHGAVYCNDDELESTAIAIGKKTGDLVHPIPYCPEFYRPEFKSQVADMKNSVADRMNAQSSCAAQFIGNNIENYLNNSGKWLHCDMAGPSHTGERATGYGVALLFGLIETLQV